MKQCRIFDRANGYFHGGILLDNGDVICGCCGSLIPADEIGTGDGDHEIIRVYDTWQNLDLSICYPSLSAVRSDD